MPLPAQTPPDAAPAGKLKVFLSYSRKDGAFAQELLAALELLGFDAYLDKEDIAPGEPWEERLGNLIRLADTVVFIISSNSLASTHCAWEVEETARAGKRLVPVMLTEVADADVPERLRKLNYVFFTEGYSFAKGLSDLTRALRADATWIREHSRYSELAARWKERGMPEALLLRGSDLEDAKLWMAVRPANAPEILASQQAYIAASAKAAEEALRKGAALRWRVQIGLAVASLAMAGLAIFAVLQWQGAETAKAGLAQTNTKLSETVSALEQTRSDLAERNKALDETNARLERKLALRAAPLANQPYDVPAGWFQVATRYAGAVAFVESAGEPGQLRASGAIVHARALDPRWQDEPVFVTADYVVADDDSNPNVLKTSDAVLVFFGPKGERLTVRLAKQLWRSSELGVSVSSLADRLPPGAAMIAQVSARPPALDALDRLTWAEVDALYDEAAMLKVTKPLRPMVIVGNLRGRQEVALSIGHLLGVVVPNGAVADERRPRATGPAIFPGATTRAITVQPAPAQLRADLIYTHATLPGGGGSPIFDAETGDLIGIHLIGLPCPGNQPPERRCAAGGTSLPRILAALAASR